VRKQLLLLLVTTTLFCIPVFGIGYAWWYFDWGHHHVEKLFDLHGKVRGFVVRKLGEPHEEFEYTMENSPNGEFRVELYNTYPPNDPLARKARILEMQWHHRPYSIAVWMHMVNGEWAVLDTCRWQKGIVF
jgi:hypothetical protein